MKFVAEEGVFNCLPWLCHTLCGIITSMSVGENLFYNDYDTAVIHSRCAMGPMFFEAVSYKVYVSICLPMYAIGLCVQIAVFVKQRDLENDLTMWKIYYSERGGAQIRLVRKIEHPSYSRLWRHQRNVISPLGSFLSLLVTVVCGLLASAIYKGTGPSSGPRFLFFCIPSLHFFCLNMIKTVCSPTLLNSLLDAVPTPWQRRRYHVTCII